MRETLRFVLAFSMAAGLAPSAWSQQAEPETILFAGGELTITETADFDKIVAFNGVEIARNYVAYLDRMAEVDGALVALFAVGDGGNACGPATVIVWQPAGESGVKNAVVGEDCGAPPAALTPTQIVFVPYLIPGAASPVQSWSPSTGVRIAGTLTFAPQPNTGWADLRPETFQNIIEALDNEALYEKAKHLLGGELEGVVTGLLVGGGSETTPSGVIYSSGCVPHACGISDSFMGIDPAKKTLFFAQKVDTPQPKAWPALADWPDDLRQAMQTALGPQ